MTWSELCCSEDFAGLWVALDNCRFEQDSRRPIEGDVVDVDPDLSELCARMRETGQCSCSILFAEDGADFSPPPSWRQANWSQRST